MNYLILIILFIIVTNNLDSQNLGLKDLRKKINVSLLINYYNPNNQDCSSSYNSFLVLDSLCSYEVNFKEINSINFSLQKNIIFYEYSFPFIYNCYNVNVIADSTIELEFRKKDTIDLQSDIMDLFKSVNLLHKKGLIAKDTVDNSIYYLSGTSFSNSIFENYYSATLDSSSIEEFINIKYYNFSPENINIDLNNLRFNFHSNVLNRRIIGFIRFDDFEEYYYLELENGVLIGL